MGRKKVGLALSGGAARGMAHIGVLEVLQSEEIPIDMIAGTSAGALVGALFARNQDAQQLKNEAINIDRRRVVRMLDITIPRTGFIEGKKLKSLLRETIGGDIKFSDLKIPLAVVTTDIMTGEEVVFKEGSVLEAVRASISLPIVFTVEKYKGRYLVDGGLTNPVPVSVLREMGADFVIAVNVIPHPADRALAGGGDKAIDKRGPNIIHVTTQSLYIGTYAMVKSSLESADVVIEPRVAHVPPYEFIQARECIQQGEIAARAAVPEIKRLLQEQTIKLEK